MRAPSTDLHTSSRRCDPADQSYPSVSIAKTATPIFFAHANGFPSGVYRKLITELNDRHSIMHLNMHAHDPRFPVNDNWGNLVDELLHYLDASKTPVWGVGHSLGGLLHYHAASKRPDLYRGIVMLDSPVLTAKDRWMIRAAKRLRLMDRITPAGRTQRRRSHFPDRDTARQYFASKPLFRAFDIDCLNDYVRYGLVSDEESGGYRLRFCHRTEVSIYRTIPHCPPSGMLSIPVAMVGGRDSHIIRPHHIRQLAKLPLGEYHAVPGTHLFPLEQPVASAQLLKKVIARWQLESEKTQ